MMNDDCLANIAKFLKPLETVRVSMTLASKSFPKKVVLMNRKQVQEFYQWAKMFDTSNLKEVEFVMNDMETFAIGMVPPSVRKVVITDYGDYQVNIPDTVEEVVFNYTRCKEISLPHSIKKLTLNKHFEGVIQVWPAKLEELSLSGWSWETEEGYLDNLPDSIRKMYLGENVPLEIRRWPVGLEHLIMHEENWGDPVNWLNIEHAIVPDDVDLEIIEAADNYSEDLFGAEYYGDGPLDYTIDDYDGPAW